MARLVTQQDNVVISRVRMMIPSQVSLSFLDKNKKIKVSLFCNANFFVALNLPDSND